MKYTPAFYAFCLFNIATPFLTGPIILMNEKVFQEWGWLDQPKLEIKNVI